MRYPSVCCLPLPGADRTKKGHTKHQAAPSRRAGIRIPMHHITRLAYKLGIRRYLPFKFALDLFLWSLTAPLAFMLRVGSDIRTEYARDVLIYTPLAVLIKAGLLYARGLARQSWHKVGVRDLMRLAQTAALSVLSLLAVAYIIPPVASIPRSVPIIDGVLGLLVLGGARLSVRLFHEYYTAERAGAGSQRVLIVGAGEAGTMIVREMLRHPEAGLVPVAYLDDDPNKIGSSSVGIPVVGPISDLSSAVRGLGIDEVLIAIPSAPGSVIRHIVDLARQARVKHRIIPGVYDILSGRASISQLRQVNLEDLLRREPVLLDSRVIAGYLEGRTILITGAGGSIGSEIARQVIRFSPQQLILLDRSENSLYMFQHELQRHFPNTRFTPVLADIQRSAELKHIFERYRPQIVFHSAAHKHVPLLEHAPEEAVINNVGGTANLLAVAAEFDIERFVNISTDKAVRPSSVMGASKRVAEMLVQAAAQRAKPGQAFISVRFGNVLGSSGSVVLIFQEQIRRGGPLTVTHPDMTRYFMSVPEATQLVLQAAALGENGAIYILDMGEPVKIVDLAHDLIELSGLQPEVDIAIEFTGPRPGEKLYEELIAADEGAVPSPHDKILTVRKHSQPDERLETLVARLLQAAYAFDTEETRRLLRELCGQDDSERRPV